MMARDENSSKQYSPKRRVYRMIISYVFSFFMALMLSVLSICLCLRIAILSESTLVKNVEKSGFTTGALEYFNNELEQSKNTSEIIKNADFSSVVSLDKITADIIGIVNSTLKGNTYSYDKSSVSENTKKAVLACMNADKREITDELTKSIDEYSSDIGDIYGNVIDKNISSYINAYKKMIDLFDSYMYTIVAATAVIITVIMLLLFKMYRHKHRALKFISTSTITTFIIMTAVPLYMIINKLAYRVNIKPKYVYDLFAKHVSEGLYIFIYVGVLWLAVSAVIMLFSHKIGTGLLSNK